MWQPEKGIMIGAVRHNDRTSVAHIFTSDHGMVPFIWFLSKSGKNASRNTLLQPLTQMEFQAEYIPTESLQHIKEIKNCSPYCDIPRNPLKSAISLFLSEFLTYALKGEQNNPRLYRYLTESLNWFDNAPDGTYANFHIAFMIGTAAYTGICPNADEYAPGSILDLREGCFCLSEPKHTEWLTKELSYKLYLLMCSDMDHINDAPLTGQERVLLLNAMNTWFRLHVPAFPVLKSIEVLDAVFS
ncbi:MAG: DNA repair protein RecO C-terminal domain-containing protein [Bacteroidaceae bacterium]|nr:DNA repair protein RecO C-terminal domain-containing protein [Bacteroidaceae bacterium]